MIVATVSSERGWRGVFRGRNSLCGDRWLIRISFMASGSENYSL
jgi:hypothetical protein